MFTIVRCKKLFERNFTQKQLIIFTSNELFHRIFVKARLQKNLSIANSEGNDFQNLLEKTFFYFSGIVNIFVFECNSIQKTMDFYLQ